MHFIYNLLTIIVYNIYVIFRAARGFAGIPHHSIRLASRTQYIINEGNFQKNEPKSQIKAHIFAAFALNGTRFGDVQDSGCACGF